MEEFQIPIGNTFKFKFFLGQHDKTPIDKKYLKSIYITLEKELDDLAAPIITKTIQDLEIDNEGFCHATFNAEETGKLKKGRYFCEIEVTTTKDYIKSKIFRLVLTEKLRK